MLGDEHAAQVCYTIPPPASLGLSTPDEKYQTDEWGTNLADYMIFVSSCLALRDPLVFLSLAGSHSEEEEVAASTATQSYLWPP